MLVFYHIPNQDGRNFGTFALGLALSAGNDPIIAAAWVEGFFSGSGLLLLHSDSLWQVLDSWIGEVNPVIFQSILPLLRRTFSTFSTAERRQMGEKAKRGGGGIKTAYAQPGAAFNYERADAVLPLLARILGLEYSGSPSEEAV